MTIIAFASCISVESDKVQQPVWSHVAAHQPEWLILCGDNIYMDYFPKLNQSKPWSPQKFADEMYQRYAAQFAVASFHSLVDSIDGGKVLGVWDDHDFAWNNCFGTDPSHGMPIKKKIATSLFHHYFSTLNTRPFPAVLPQLPIPDLLNPPRGTDNIYGSRRIGPLQTLICDGRSFREDNTTGTTSASLLGDAQEAWLLNELNEGSGPFLIVSGSTMTSADDQSWDTYDDFYRGRFLPAVGGKTVLFLAGDVHENRLPPKVGQEPIEIVSSAAVLGFPFNKRNFGILEASEHAVTVFLYKRNKVQYTGMIDLGSGAFKSNMLLVTETPEPPASPELVQKQKHAAMLNLTSQ